MPTHSLKAPPKTDPPPRQTDRHGATRVLTVRAAMRALVLARLREARPGLEEGPLLRMSDRELERLAAGERMSPEDWRLMERAGAMHLHSLVEATDARPARH